MPHGRASLRDIVTVESPRPTRRASVADIVSVEPPAPPPADEEPPSFFRRAVVPTAMRIVPSLVGGVAGSFLSPGFGTAAGAAAGAGLGETAAEWYERRIGLRDRLNPTQIAVQTGLGAIPLGKVPGVSATAGELTKYATRLPLRRAMQGAALGTGAGVVTQLAETGELPSARQLGEQAVVGGAMGGAFGKWLEQPQLSRRAATVSRMETFGKWLEQPHMATASAGTASLDDIVSVEVPAAPVRPVGDQPGLNFEAVPDEPVAPPRPVPEPPPSPDVAVQPRASIDDVVAVVDRLDTGEQQPRLPEAGPVRDVEQPTPQMDAPFTLSREASPTPPERQAPLLGDEPPRVTPSFTPDQVSREIRRMAAELDALPFDRGGLWEQGGESGFTPRAAGAGVYHDIVQTAGSSATRRQVQTAIDKYLGGQGKGTATTRALEEVAAARLRGSMRVSKPFLPPDAGDTYRLPGEAAPAPPTVRGEDLSLEDWFTESSRREAEGLPALERPRGGVASRPHMPHDRASLTRWLQQLPAEQAERPQMRPTEIVKTLREGLKALPVKTGHFREKAHGIYKVEEQVVRLKIANDLDTLAHEVGHHLHEAVLGATDVPYARSLSQPGQASRTRTVFRDELLKLGAETSRSSYTVKQRLAEGQAEFTRYFLSEPDKAKQLAPNYFRAFETALQKQPELAAVLRQGQRQLVGHFALDPVAQVKSRIDFTGRTPASPSSLAERLKVSWIDDLEPLRRAVADLNQTKPAAAAEDAYVLARLARGAAAKAEGFIRYGVKDRSGVDIAPALEPALRSVANRSEDFSTYLVASRAVELRGRGIESGISLPQAQKTVKRLQSPAFVKARDAVYAYQRGLLEYARLGGALSNDQVAAIQTLNQFFVPFQRVMDAAGRAAGATSDRLANRGLPVKRIKGSGRDIINPLESIIKNTHAVVDMVEKNRAMLALAKHAASVEGGGRYVEAIPTPKETTSFNLDMVRRAIGEALDEAGVEVGQVMGPRGPQLEVAGQVIDLDTLVKVFTPAQFAKGDQGIITAIKNGERAFYSVNDLALYDAINAIGPQHAPLVMHLLMRPARFLRAAATTTVGFIARNPIRDTLAATINSRYGFKPGLDTVRGLFEYLKKGQLYEDFLNSGAANASLVSGDRDRIRAQLRRAGIRNPSLAGRAGEVITSPVELLRAVSEAMENATRLGEFRRALVTEGRTPSGMAKAGLAARDVTLDFGRGGRLSKEANRYVAFFNAAMQGSARVAEVFTSDPVGATMRAATAVTMPTLALWYLNRDNPEYREIPDWEKHIYWHIPLGERKGFAKLPKPQVFGEVFANVPEAALDFLATKDPAAADRLFADRDAAWLAFMNLVPTALMPLVEVGTNFDTFRGRAIVNPFDKDLEPELQVNRWTSETAKLVGRGLGVSPAKIDHLVTGYGAGFARGVVQAGETGASILGLKPKAAKPAGGPGRAPLVGTFYRPGLSDQAQSLQRFFRDRDLLNGTLASIAQFEKNGQRDKARALARERRGLLERSEQLRAADGVLRELRRGINAVFADQSMAAQQKRQRLDRLGETMVDVAREADGKPPIYRQARRPSAIPPALPQAAGQ